MNLYKKSHQITIRDYSIMEQTGKLNHLSNVPYVIVKNEVKKELDKLSKILNSDGDDDNEELKWKIHSLLKINAIESNYLGIINSFDLGLKVNTFRLLLNRRFRRRIKIENKNAQKFISNIKKYTGIEIKELKDLEKVRETLQFRKDKFNENFTKKQDSQTTKVYLMSIVLGVFSYLNQPINEDMTIVNFIVLRNEANKGIKREKSNK